MAHKKGQGSSRNGRDSNAQRRGVKKFGGEQVIPAILLFAKSAPSGIQVPMLEWAKITPFFRW